MFEYRWLDSTLDKLAAIYVAADVPDRDRMAVGVEQFNARLASDPLGIGESRPGGYRVAFPPLLRVYYHVDEATRRVRVVDVIRYGR
jgi:plasmid stabilization system protein ParE